MEIKAAVHSISKLKDYFFIVPDYQREYVWDVDDQVEQFLVDIDNEFDADAIKQRSYFIGSIILVENNTKFDVIDGQQRLTTLVLTLCALRELLIGIQVEGNHKEYLNTIKEWLYSFDIESDETQVRLELQYEESKDYLTRLISSEKYNGEQTGSIIKMQEAYVRIFNHIERYLKESIDDLMSFVKYFLTKIELVVIETENLSSALKIFETINQRGAGLNAMDLVKNLLFSEAKEPEFKKIKAIWKVINSNLQSCGEDQSPLRYLRYFLMARHHDGILREDEIYKWIISVEGKKVTQYEDQPLILAKELEGFSKRYADLVNATMLNKDGGAYPCVTRIGFMNKYKSRQHLILLLAITNNGSSDKSMIEYLAKQLESFFFFSNTIGIQAKNNEHLFTQWAVKIRAVKSQDDLVEVVEETIVSYLREKLSDFRQSFLSLKSSKYNPLYRLRYILGRIENTALSKSGLPKKGMEFFDSLQIEHILPQSPRDDILTAEFSDIDDYNGFLWQLGNVTLLESTINQAVQNYNNLDGDWFEKKQAEYIKSDVVTTALLNHEYLIGKNTQLNKFKEKYGYQFETWTKESIKARQKVMMGLAIETWLLNGHRLDE